MIEIINKTDVQYVFYPKTQNSTGPYTLHIHSELSQKDWHFENVEDKASLHDYYKFLVDYSNVDDGEFDYQIISNEEVMDTGLIRIGIGQASVRGYDTPNEIIQYDMYGAPTERYQHKSISATSNGTYNVLPDEDYVALSEVDVYVNVPSDSGASYESGYTKGYESGYTQGSEDGYGSGYTKGTADGYGSGYTSGKTDGYNSGYTQGYTGGKTDGIAEQKAKLVATAVTSNGTYSRPDGYSSVQVSIPQTGHTDEEMQQAYASGQTYQKSLLVSTAVTSNGTYSRSNGYSSFVVNVAQTGHTDQELHDAFNSGYTNGKAEGYNSGWTNGYNSGKTDGYDSGWTGGYDSGWTDGYISGYTDGSGQTPSTAATALTISVPSSITGSGKVNVTAEPSTAVLDLVYTSSDPTIARVNSNGNITVLSAGTITITVTDRNSGLFDTQTITVEPGGWLNTPLTFNIISGGTIKWCRTESTTGKRIQYSLNNGEWTSITSNIGSSAPSISVSTGDKIQFKGTNPTYSSYDRQYSTFSGTTARFEVEGNIMSLIDSDNFATVTSLATNVSYTFYRLFYDCTGLTSAENLVLPATSLTENCYCLMFGGCTFLTAAPSTLPATNLKSGCYEQMFYNCTSLTTAPSLPATILVNECYDGMFNGCTSLTTAPELHVATLTNNCYLGMFNGCTSLNYIKCLATDISAPNCTYTWVRSVASSGTFVKSASMTGWTSGDDGIPTGWTVVDAQ